MSATPPAADRRPALSPLDRKLGRDLWRMKGQAAAIAAVIAVGVLTLVMMDGLVLSLDETKRAYYERYRLTDLFAPLKRAPRAKLADLAALPGVAAVEGRIVGGALIDLPDRAVPVRARTVSLPRTGLPRLNDVHLVEGRRPDPARAEEALLLNGFARARNIRPGDRLSAIVNGGRRSFRIVGLVEAPEFLYAAPPGEMMPDDARFAVLWLGERTLAAAYDLDGAFNEALLRLTRDANPEAVLRRVDAALAVYGGRGAYLRKDHVSERFISEEIDGLRVTSRIVPPIFLAVAAFLLNIVIARMLQAEREQIGLLKAFGYSNREIGLHYLKFILAIAGGGALLGCALGMIAGRYQVDIFLIYYKIPFLVFEIDPGSVLIGIAVSTLAAAAGGLLVLRRIFALTPAVAMRPPAPADYSRAIRFGALARRLLDQPTRMVLRRLLREPLRSASAILGIAAGMALSLAMSGVMSGFDRAMMLSFTLVDRSDLSLSLIEPYGDATLYELRRHPGVFDVEPFRSVPAVLRNGRHSYRSALTGLPEAPRLQRVMDAEQRALTLPREGVILSEPLARILHLRPGDRLQAEITEGHRPVLDLPVVGVAQTLMGAPAFVAIDALNRALDEPGRVNGAYMKIDDSAAEPLYRAFKNMPTVAGLSLKREARAAFRKVIDSGAGAVRYIMAAVAAIITFGIVYNSARIAFAERARDLASLRVLGFTTGETAFVLLGELGVIILLALPLGGLLGHQLAFLLAEGFSTDLYQIPAQVLPENIGAALVAVLAAATVSGLLVYRDLGRIDLVSTLKTRE